MRQLPFFFLSIALSLPLSAQSWPSPDGAINAAIYPGSDMGEQINNAIASVGCGEVFVPKGIYTVTTTIKKPRCIKLRGQSAYGTILNWTSVSGTEIVISDHSGELEYSEGEISDLTIQGPGRGKSSGTGLYIGGNPESDPNGYGDHQNINRVRILGWKKGITWGNNTWDITVLESLISNNDTGLYYPSGLDNSGESLNFIGSSTQNNHVALDLMGFADFYFSHCRCDYNDTCGTVGSAIFVGEHFEQPSGTILTIKGTFQPNVSIIGGWALLQATKGIDNNVFDVAAGNPQFWIQGIWVNSNHPVKHMIHWGGSHGSAVLNVGPLPYYNAHGYIPNLTDTDCAFQGCVINDGQGNFSFAGKNSSVLMNGAALFKSLAIQQAPEPSKTASDYSVPIQLNGKTYYLRLSSKP